jgi:hypothetical protein
MTDVPYYMVEAAANEDGLFVAVGLWSTVELDIDSDTPMMAGGSELGIESTSQPDSYQQFLPIMCLVRGELALYRMLERVAGLAELDRPHTQLWIDSIMIGLNEFVAASES